MMTGPPPIKRACVSVSATSITAGTDAFLQQRARKSYVAAITATLDSEPIIRPTNRKYSPTPSAISTSSHDSGYESDLHRQTTVSKPVASGGFKPTREQPCSRLTGSASGYESHVQNHRVQHPRRISRPGFQPPPLPNQAAQSLCFVQLLINFATSLTLSIWPLSNHGRGYPLVQFVTESLRRSKTSYSTLQVALYYLVLLKGQVPHRRDLTCEQSRKQPIFLQCGRRMFLTSLVLAAKYLQDKNFSTQAWGKITGLDSSELNDLQRIFLQRIDYRLHMPAELWQTWSKFVCDIIPDVDRTPPPTHRGWGTKSVLQTEPAPDWDGFVRSMTPESFQTVESASALRDTFKQSGLKIPFHPVPYSRQPFPDPIQLATPPATPPHQIHFEGGFSGPMVPQTDGATFAGATPSTETEIGAGPSPPLSQQPLEDDFDNRPEVAVNRLGRKSGLATPASEGVEDHVKPISPPESNADSSKSVDLKRKPHVTHRDADRLIAVQALLELSYPRSDLQLQTRKRKLSETVDDLQMNVAALLNINVNSNIPGETVLDDPVAVKCSQSAELATLYTRPTPITNLPGGPQPHRRVSEPWKPTLRPDYRRSGQTQKKVRVSHPEIVSLEAGQEEWLALHAQRNPRTVIEITA